jgi:predicted AlkP superfamily phosphohydrolase/phosphomutase
VKILVVGLDCAAPELLFGDEQLPNFRRLMDIGCYGRLESVIPPITVPAWMCMSTSQDPGSLGVYGFRNRLDHSYAGLGFVNSSSIRELTTWDQVAREGKKSIIVGVPPSYPPRKINGICVGCFLTPDTTTDAYTYPADIKEEIHSLVGEYPVDVKGFRTDQKDWLRDQIFDMSRKQFSAVRHLMHNHEWDYFHFVDIGLDRVHHGFWKHHDPEHVFHEPNSPYKHVIRDYYKHLDEEFGQILELLTDDTVVLVVSDHGAQRLDGGFCINEWLIQEGLLVLNSYPEEITPFSELDINWSKTKVWGEGGYYARIFFNVRGREPEGVIDPADYETFRDEIKARLEATVDQEGEPFGTEAFKPEEAYKSVRNIAPDLIVLLGGLYWRSIGTVGHASVHTRENDTGPDDCNHAMFGSFILASSNNPLQGEVNKAHLLDIAPTLLELGGYDIPPSMQGKSLIHGKLQTATAAAPHGEDIIRERLSGLGYIET